VKRRWLRLAMIYASLLVAGWLAGKWLLDVVTIDIATESPERVRVFVILATVAFMVASAVPFVPGIEIGLGLILAFGAKMAVLVYASLVIALTTSFLVGRFVPVERVAAAFAYLGLTKARDLALRLAPLAPDERRDLLTAQMPKRVAPLLLRYRYLALVVLFNVPGNSVIGGGGGIAFTAGLSGLYSIHGFILSLAIGAVPVPLFILMGEHFGR
jgi:hypothetical protein